MHILHVDLRARINDNLSLNLYHSSDHDYPKLLNGEKLGLQRRALYAYSLDTRIRHHANPGTDRIIPRPGQNCHVSSNSSYI